MFDEQNEQHNSSNNERDSDGDGTDAVEYGSCQHPVVLDLVLFVTLVLFFVDVSFQEVADFLQLFLHRFERP